MGCNELILALATVNVGPIWLAEVSGSCCLCFSWKVCTGTGGQEGLALLAGGFLQGLGDEEGSARGCGDVLQEDFKPNPRLVTKCRLRGALSVPAAPLHPQPGLAEELELLGTGQGLVALLSQSCRAPFPGNNQEHPSGGKESALGRGKSRDGRGGLLVPELEQEVGVGTLAGWGCGSAAPSCVTPELPSRAQVRSFSYEQQLLWICLLLG